MTEHVGEPQKGTLIRVGLTTGQTLLVLANHIHENLDELVMTSDSGDVVAVRQRFIAYTRESEVDMPTEDEIAAYEASLKAKSSANYNITANDLADSGPDFQAHMARMYAQQSPYL